MENFKPDLDFLVDQIADAYVFVNQSLDNDNIALAEYWQQQLSLLTAGLDAWVAQERK